MKRELRSKKWQVIAITILLIAFGSGSVFAKPTVSGTKIINKAYVNFKVGGLDQPVAQNPDQCSFIVDTKVDLEISVESTDVSITPGASERLLQFKITNSGNKEQAFKLRRQQIAGAATAKNVEIYYDDGGTTGVLDATDTRLTLKNGVMTTFFNLEDNTESELIFVSANFENTVTNGQDANFEVAVITCDVSSLTNTEDDDTAEDINTEEVVHADGAGFTDAAGDGIITAFARYVVSSAVLSVTKVSTVISDGFNASNFKRIPGALIEYVITVSNAAGAADATAIAVSDTLSTNLQFNTEGYGAGKGIRYINTASANTEYTSANDGDDGEFASGAVTVAPAAITIPGGQNVQFKFRANIK